jgi:hypothetical protein
MEYVSVNTVILKVIRDLNLDKEERYSDFIEWAFEAMQHIGTFSQYTPKIVDLEVKDYITELPCDVYKTVLVSMNGCGLRFEGNLTPYKMDDPEGIESTNLQVYSDQVYRIDYPYIKTNFRTGTITVEYVAHKLDEDGLPLIPDDISFHQALFWYILKMLILGGWKHPDRSIGYMMADQQWAFYCGQAKGRMYMPSLAEMENYKNMRYKLIPELNHYSSALKNINSAQNLNKHGIY